jgi:lipoprotein-releasing system ATP-binding protein
MSDADNILNDKKIVLVVNDIKKTYRTGPDTLSIITGVTFSAARGQTISITGESGSGKSTLLNIIGALDSADSGTVTINDFLISGKTENELNRLRQNEIGFIFQFHYLLNDFTALENVMLPAYIAGLKKKEALEKAQALLTDVHMEQRATHFPSELSGGERQRVAVARALVNNPAIILADEPTGNLDVETSHIVSDILFECASKYNKTLLIVTHDLSIASRAETKYTLQNGILTNV